MCGLFGFAGFDRALSPAEVKAFEAATATLAHRGPDNQGGWTAGGTYLGHRRLSIIDLSATANQPFQDDSGRHVLIYNGEVYNYLELKAELEAEGVPFRTSSDTEVVLEALKRWGRQALNRFDGMFAGAWHDRTLGRTILFRDPLGQKPLYWSEGAGGIAFASELRALLSLPNHPPTLDLGAFHRFMARGYYAWDETPVAGIRKLLPGCLLTIENGRATEERYWDSVPGRDRLDISDIEALDEFDRLFSRSCVQSMRCDVPYGVFLSGGIDSSLVMDYCKQANPHVRAFCVAMGEADFDESAKAETLALHLGIEEFHRFVMGHDSVAECLESALALSDEPHADPGWVNAYFLARSCRPYMTVGLAGDGGDELFAGYAPFAGLRPARVLAALPDGAIAALKLAARLVPPSDRYMGLRFKLDSYLRGFPASETERCARWLSALNEDDLARLTGGAGATSPFFPSLNQVMAPVAGSSDIQRMLYFYQKMFLPEFVCSHTDRAAMQMGMEVRSPFLSVPLIEFANRLPDRLKIRGGTLKYLLKQAAARRGLPDAILRQKKQGFTFPVARWLKTLLHDRLMGLLANDGWHDGLVDPSEIRHMIDQHLGGRANHYRVLYSLIVFAAWRRRYPALEIR